MAYIYVYAPINGTQAGQDLYCDGKQHNPGILCCGENDILGAASSAVKFYSSSYIKSIRTTQLGNLCATSPPAGFEWVNEGVKIELYCNYDAQSALIATLFYGHLTNRIANGVYNSPNSRTLGRLGSQDCNCACYDGIHVHTECDSSGYRIPRGCGVGVYTTSQMYRWTVPDLSACPQ